MKNIIKPTVKIKQIQEQTVDLMLNDEVVGQITSGLQLTDVCVQIKKQQLENYFIKYAGEIFPITKDGRVMHNRTLYPLLGKLLRELI